MKVLITAFDAFEGIPVNPSALMLEGIAALCRDGILTGIETRLLPTAYESAGRIMSELIGSLEPDVVIATGVAQFRQNITIERVALNLDDADAPDNAGEIRRGSPIDPSGALALKTSCDVAGLSEMLRRAGYRAEVSNHAGTYVCNHVYYCALAAGAGRQPVCVFVHVPNAGDAASAWQISDLVAAMTLIIGHLAPACLTPTAGPSA